MARAKMADTRHTRARANSLRYNGGANYSQIDAFSLLILSSAAEWVKCLAVPVESKVPFGCGV